jgi:uncharacterized SAM-binding protein YcdF (DUF218 family)
MALAIFPILFTKSNTMFFVLSKTIDFLAMPVTIVALLMLAGLLVKNPKRKKQLLWTAFILFMFFSNDFISNEVMRWWEVDATPYDEVKPHALGIVLTGTTIPQLTPNDRVYFSRGADRVTHTVELYHRGLIKKILVSGGSGLLVGEDEPEANKYRRAMTMMGVPAEDILLENETRNTYESAVQVRPMLDSLNFTAKDCLLITSAFHLRRSAACYRKAGLELEMFSVDFYAHPRHFYPGVFLIPKVEALVIWHKLVKEWLGMAAYKVAGYI